MNDEFEKVRKLIGLKKHESTPSPDFVERFVDEFQRRQRAELLKQPSFGSFIAQLKDLLAGSPGFRAAFATATVAVIAVAAWLMMPGGQGGAGQLAEGAKGAAGKNAAFSVENVRMIEVQYQPDIQPQVLTQEMEKNEGPDVVIVPTGDDTGIAVPAGVFIKAYEEASGK